MCIKTSRCCWHEDSSWCAVHFSHFDIKHFLCLGFCPVFQNITKTWQYGTMIFYVNKKIYLIESWGWYQKVFSLPWMINIPPLKTFLWWKQAFRQLNIQKQSSSIPSATSVWISKHRKYHKPHNESISTPQWFSKFSLPIFHWKFPKNIKASCSSLLTLPHHQAKIERKHSSAVFLTQLLSSLIDHLLCIDW